MFSLPRSSGSRLLSCAMGLVFLAGSASAGDIVGRVELMEKGGRKASDLSDVVVYVDNARTRATPGQETIVMKSKAFSPHVTVVSTGTTIEFPNEDPILHNVFSASGGGFDLGLYKRPKKGSRTFDKAGIYTLYCNIHPQMSATVIVRDNPYYAKADPDGSFRIAGLPPGEYKVVAFHERSGEGAPVAVKVPDKGEAAVALSLDAASYKKLPHKNKFGKEYGREVY